MFLHSGLRARAWAPSPAVTNSSLEIALEQAPFPQGADAGFDHHRRAHR
jgi:hypothetical protein